MFQKVLFMWSDMPIFSFIGYILTELFRKPDNWRQIYKQTSSTFYTSNDVSRRKNLLVLITELRNSYLITLLKRYRSSHRRCSVKKGVLKNFANFTGKHPCWSLFFNEVAGFQPASFLKKDSSAFQHKCFPVKFAKLLRTPI